MSREKETRLVALAAPMGFDACRLRAKHPGGASRDNRRVPFSTPSCRTRFFVNEREQPPAPIGPNAAALQWRSSAHVRSHLRMTQRQVRAPRSTFFLAPSLFDGPWLGCCADLLPPSTRQIPYASAAGEAVRPVQLDLPECPSIELQVAA
ncbi:hypothetical protein HETIRDRAFT_104576 [Heterobasidion irregulare TC 32-1]|uniref:Uncharacterized protein n=1 Tax=Heterobasidion irregulare (strain TC 32-1) TaxID=747525 RepID=W4K1V3_HETIT|nr:uncharacterized protein HETIRDRAFT_104576 [Heterobasidion irregulare TC 32-1]ETW79315.1 hypothetical protein HETIRDRAFT_104576 [Heterobasidion irregulare TC 32-1]